MTPLIDPNQLFQHKLALRRENQEFFRGRADVLHRALIQILVPGSALVLYGQRGIGKTSLAWQLLEILSGRTALLDNLKVRRPASLSVYDCVWFECLKKKTTDLSDVLAGLLRSRDDTPTLRDQFPEAFTQDFEGRFLAADDAKESKRFGMLHTLFEELLSRISRKLKSRELIVFLDEFDRVDDKSGIGDLLKSTRNTRFVIVGVADDLTDIIKDHESVARKLSGSGIEVPGMTPEEILSIIDRAESVYPDQLRFEDDFRNAVVTKCDGSPSVTQLIGWHSVSARLNDDSTPTYPIQFAIEDFHAGVRGILMPGRKKKEDPYRLGQIAIACRGSDIRQNILILIATSQSEWMGEEEVKNGLFGNARKNFDQNLRKLIDGDILRRKQDTRQIKFRDPMLKLFIRIISERGPDALANLS